MGEIKETVQAIKDKPGKRWEGIVDKVLLVFVGAVIGYIMIKLGF